MAIIITNENAGVGAIGFTSNDATSANVLLHCYMSHYSGDYVHIADTIYMHRAIAGTAGSREMTDAINRTWVSERGSRMQIIDDQIVIGTIEAAD